MSVFTIYSYVAMCLLVCVCVMMRDMYVICYFPFIYSYFKLLFLLDDFMWSSNVFDSTSVTKIGIFFFIL